MIKSKLVITILLVLLWHATSALAQSMTAKQASQLFSTVLITGNEGANYVEALEVLSQTKGYRDRMQTYCAQALCHYGWILINNDRIELAERIFHEAQIYVPSTDSARYYDILSGLAYCYLKSGKSSQTKKILQQLMAYHKSQKMSTLYIADIENMGNYYQSINMPGKAIEYLRKSQKLALQAKDWLQACFINFRIITIIIDTNEKINILNETLNMEIQHNLPQIMPQTHYYLSKAYYEGQQYEQALKEANTALDGTSKFAGSVDSTDVIRLLAQIYTARQNFELANYYYHKTDEHMQKAIVDNGKKIAEQSRIANELISWCSLHLVRKSTGEFELKDKNDRLSISMIVSLSLIAGCMLIGMFLFTRYRKRKDKEVNTLTKRLDSQNEKINRMESTIGYLLLFYNNQNVLLTKIHNLIKQVVGRDNENNTRLRNIGHFIQDNKLDSIQTEFAEHEKQQTTDFIDRLTRLYPDLTDAEKQMAVYLWRGLSTHEICVLTGNQPRSVNMSRHRLRKSMSLNNEEDLVEHLKNI